MIVPIFTWRSVNGRCETLMWSNRIDLRKNIRARVRTFYDIIIKTFLVHICIIKGTWMENLSRNREWERKKRTNEIEKKNPNQRKSVKTEASIHHWIWLSKVYETAWPLKNKNLCFFFFYFPYNCWFCRFYSFRNSTTTIRLIAHLFWFFISVPKWFFFLLSNFMVLEISFPIVNIESVLTIRLFFFSSFDYSFCEFFFFFYSFVHSFNVYSDLLPRSVYLSISIFVCATHLITQDRKKKKKKKKTLSPAAAKVLEQFKREHICWWMIFVWPINCVTFLFHSTFTWRYEKFIVKLIRQLWINPEEKERANPQALG